MLSVSCPQCRADLGSAPAELTAIVGPALEAAHQCRPAFADKR
jgi:hypothetical protein